MKINMSFNNRVLLEGYENIDPFALPNDKFGRINCHPDNLNLVVNDGQADEIIANLVLNYISHTKLYSTLKMWSNKLAHNGTLEIFYIDLIEVSRLVTTGQITENNAIELIYGSQKEEWDFFKSSISIYELKMFFENAGLVVEHVGKKEHLSKIKVRRK